MPTQPVINKTDVKILKTLLQDPRTSFAKIAKDCKLSTNTIRMRVKRLKELGVITGAIMQVNPKSLGYNCIALLSIQADATKEAVVYDFLENLPEIIKSFQPIGKYNIHSFAALKSVDDLAHTVERIKSHPDVLDVEKCIWVDVVRMDHPENLVIEPFDGIQNAPQLVSKDENSNQKIMPSRIAKVTKEKCYSPDKIDMSIIRILSENASMSFRKIAKQIGVSTQSVIRRYERMKKTILPHSSITLDLKKIGYESVALFYVTTSSQHRVSKVFEEIVRVPNVIVACKCLGTIDIFVAVPFSSFSQLLTVKQGIFKIEGIKQIEVFIDKPFSSWPMNLFAHVLQKQM